MHSSAAAGGDHSGVGAGGKGGGARVRDRKGRATPKARKRRHKAQLRDFLLHSDDVKADDVQDLEVAEEREERQEEARQRRQQRQQQQQQQRQCGKGVVPAGDEEEAADVDTDPAAATSKSWASVARTPPPSPPVAGAGGPARLPSPERLLHSDDAGVSSSPPLPGAGSAVLLYGGKPLPPALMPSPPVTVRSLSQEGAESALGAPRKSVLGDHLLLATVSTSRRGGRGGRGNRGGGRQTHAPHKSSFHSVGSEGVGAGAGAGAGAGPSASKATSRPPSSTAPPPPSPATASMVAVEKARRRAELEHDLESCRRTAAATAAAMLSSALMPHLFPAGSTSDRPADIASEGGGPAAPMAAGVLPSAVYTGLQKFLSSQLTNLLVKHEAAADADADGDHAASAAGGSPHPATLSAAAASPAASAGGPPASPPGRHRHRPRRPSLALDVSWAVQDNQPTEAFWKEFCSKLLPAWVREVVHEPRDSGLAPRSTFLPSVVLRLPCARTHVAKALAEVCMHHSSLYVTDRRALRAAVFDTAPALLPHAVELRPSSPPPAVARALPSGASASLPLHLRMPMDDGAEPDLTFLLEFLAAFAELVAMECNADDGTDAVAASEEAKGTDATGAGASPGSAPSASWFTVQVELLMRSCAALLRVGDVLDSHSHVITAVLSHLLPVRPHVAPYFLKRLLNAWPSEGSRQVAWLQIAQHGLQSSPPAALRNSRTERALMRHVFRCVNSSHIGVAHAALALCSNMYIVLHYGAWMWSRVCVCRRLLSLT